MITGFAGHNRKKVSSTDPKCSCGADAWRWFSWCGYTCRKCDRVRSQFITWVVERRNGQKWIPMGYSPECKVVAELRKSNRAAFGKTNVRVKRITTANEHEYLSADGV